MGKSWSIVSTIALIILSSFVQHHHHQRKTEEQTKNLGKFDLSCVLCLFITKHKTHDICKDPQKTVPKKNGNISKFIKVKEEMKIDFSCNLREVVKKTDILRSGWP